MEDFEIFVPNVDEESLTVSDPIETARAIAMAKAKIVAAERPDCLVIAGDTVVSLGKKQFAKPTSPENAMEILKALSGKTHQVITGVAMIWPEGEALEHDITEVTFNKLDAATIKAYVETGEPMDKAGAYASQGGAKTFIKEIKGSLTNVIGLPSELVLQMFERVTAC